MNDIQSVPSVSMDVYIQKPFLCFTPSVPWVEMVAVATNNDNKNIHNDAKDCSREWALSMYYLIRAWGDSYVK